MEFGNYHTSYIYLVFGFSDGSNEGYWAGYTEGKRNDTMGLEYSSNTTLAKEFWATVSIFAERMSRHDPRHGMTELAD